MDSSHNQISFIGSQLVSQWEHALQQRVAAFTFQRDSFGLLMAILYAATWPIPTPSKMTIHLTQPRVVSQSVSQWEHAPRQCIAVSTCKRYSFSLLMAILQAVTRPIPTPAKMMIHLTQLRVIWMPTSLQIRYILTHMRKRKAEESQVASKRDGWMKDEAHDGQGWSVFQS